MSLVHPLKDFAFSKASSYEVVCCRERLRSDRKAGLEVRSLSEEHHEIIFTFKLNCPAVILVVGANGRDSTCTLLPKAAVGSVSARLKATYLAT